MDFKSLNYVLAVARTGSISKAAKNLGISQPSLSRYIQNLNDRLGVQLFVRRADRLILTEAGERYAQKAERMLEISKEFYADGPKIQTAKTSSGIVVSTPFKEGYYIHPFAIMQFTKRYPTARLILERNDGTAPFVDNGRDMPDIAIAVRDSEYEDIVFEPLLQDEICLITAAGHALGQRAIWREGCRHLWADIESAKYENFILPPEGSTLGRRIREFLDGAGISPGEIAPAVFKLHCGSPRLLFGGAAAQARHMLFIRKKQAAG
jgi:molybdate transport repressor ModE-like protein